MSLRKKERKSECKRKKRKISLRKKERKKELNKKEKMPLRKKERKKERKKRKISLRKKESKMSYLKKKSLSLSLFSSLLFSFCHSILQNGSSLKLVDKFTYLGSSASSTETDISMRLAKAWTAIDILQVIWKPHLTDIMKRIFFQSAVVSILLCGCTLHGR